MVYWRQDFRTFLVYISLFHLFILELVESDCPSFFRCGDLGYFGFPLSNYTHPECGLVKVECDIRPRPKIYLQNEWFSPNEWFSTSEILGKLSSNRLYVRNLHMYEFLMSEDLDQKCKAFDNYSSPNTSSISFSFSPNISLLICAKNVNLSEFQRYRSYRECEHDVYYTIPNDAPVPSGCSSRILPVKSSSDSDDLLNQISSEYTLEWTVSDKCMDCHRKGGLCTTDPHNDFRCDKAKSKVKLIVPLTVIPASIILCGVGFLVWRRRRRIKNAYLLPRNISSDPSSRSDLEGGSVYFGIPVFSYTELEEATNNFDVSKELGDGGFGTVYHGKLRDGRDVAIKRLYEHNYKRVEQFMNEIKILTCLRHRNLVSLYGCTSRRSRELLLVYEYVRNGTVADHIHGERANEAPLSWSIRMNIAIETACALAYLHKSDIIHRDVKTNNILLDDNFCVKVADFGLSRLFPTDVTHISTAPQGTPGYVDPEYHQCYQLTSKSDVYSFGVVLIELISSMPAVDISRHRHEINLANLAISKIQQCAFDELIDPSLGFGSDAEVTRMTTSVAELAFRCLQLEKDMRPDMDEALAFLKEVRGDEDSTFENKMAPRDNDSVPKSVKIPNSPETDDIILLKSKYLQSSPNAVTDMWMISSSTTASSIG